MKDIAPSSSSFSSASSSSSNDVPAPKSIKGSDEIRSKGLSNLGLLQQLLEEASSVQHISTDDADSQAPHPDSQAPHPESSSSKKRKTESFAPDSPKTIVSGSSMTVATKLLQSMKLDKKIMFEALLKLEKSESRDAFLALEPDLRLGYIGALLKREL